MDEAIRAGAAPQRMRFNVEQLFEITTWKPEKFLTARVSHITEARSALGFENRLADDEVAFLLRRFTPNTSDSIATRISSKSYHVGYGFAVANLWAWTGRDCGLRADVEGACPWTGQVRGQFVNRDVD